MDKIVNVLITGVGGNIGQGVIKSLKMSNLKCRIVGTDIKSHSTGFFTIDKGYIVPKANDDRFLDKIIEICNSENIDIIFVSPPIELPIFSKNKEIIENKTKAKVVINTEEVIRIGNDKFETYKFLKENNLNYPETVLASDEDGIKQLIDKLGFPLIIKPRVGRGSVGVHKVKDKDELYSLLKIVDSPIVQEYLEPDDEEYTSEALVLNGKMLGSITMKRELLEGTTVSAIVDDYEEINEVVKKAALAIGSNGPCNFQLRLTKKGPTVFEINPRVSGTTPMRAKLGFNAPEAMIRKIIFNEDVGEMKYKKGTILRYWNEVYVFKDYQESLEKDKFIEDAESEVDNNF
ncbi:hypothetical protein CL617_03475 [archaeon]|nr:hypothetical protein [archaeon]|tara:strand:- start:15616 stop:16656 length:1041 start_codon:yes stop_codon:yes gene_type:complete